VAGAATASWRRTAFAAASDFSVPIGGMGLLVCSNNGGGPRVPFRAKVKICWMLVPINLAKVLCYKRLRRRTPLGASCLEIAGSDGIRSCAPMFYI
jgi:hypothetical protein